MSDHPQYWCGGCCNEIYPQQIRFECKVCHSYSSCMSCQLLGTASGSHQTSHPTHITQPSHPLTRASPYLPGFSPNFPTHRGSYTPAPPPPPPPAPPQNAEQYWGTLITPEKTASPMLCALIDAAFTYFDATVAPTHTGYLEPEKYSAFLKALGWSHSAPTTLATDMFNDPGDALQVIDTLTTAFYMQCNMEHRMVTRPMPQSEDAGSWQVVENGMPLLPRLPKESMVIEIMANPEECQAAFNRLISATSLIHGATGMSFKYLEIPRCCFPAEKDLDAVRKDAFDSAQLSRLVRDMAAEVQQAAVASAESRQEIIMANARQEEKERAEQALRDAEAENAAIRQIQLLQQMMEMQIQEDNRIQAALDQGWAQTYSNIYSNIR